MYGTQTRGHMLFVREKFENDVKMYGTQTYNPCDMDESMFENDVKMYGTQTSVCISYIR